MIIKDGPYKDMDALAKEFERPEFADKRIVIRNLMRNSGGQVYITAVICTDDDVIVETTSSKPVTTKSIILDFLGVIGVILGLALLGLFFKK